MAAAATTSSSSTIDPICNQIPNLLSSFIDSFVDFTVSGGLFLPPDSNPQTTPDISQNSQTILPPPQTYFPPPSRLIAVGDIHGDLEKSKQSLRLAGIINDSDKWSGGDATVVQIGDVLDRGGDELKVLYFLEKLRREALKCGGNLITMNGNHEIMNVEGDFRYVTELGLDEFENWSFWYCLGEKMKGLCPGFEKGTDIFDGIPLRFRGVKEEFLSGMRARIAALRPDGPIAKRFLARNSTVLVVGDSVFVHGGLLAQHVEHGLERINVEVRDWISGATGRSSAPGYCRGRNALVWLRKFSEEEEKKCDCFLLEHVLATIPGAKRMIMGHTIQEAGINGICNNKAIRIDVGMSKGCIDGLPEVLEISGNSSTMRVLTSHPLYEKKYKHFLETEKKEGLQILLEENRPRQVEVKA